MTRLTYAGGPEDYVVDAARVPVEGATVTFWDAEVGGTQLADLVLNGAPTAEIITQAKGIIPDFQGPNGRFAPLWADAGAGRWIMSAKDLDKIIDAGVSATVVNLADYAIGGGADDTANINDALAALPAAGGVLKVSGVYKTTGGHVIDKPGTVILGDSCDSPQGQDGLSAFVLTTGVGTLFNVATDNVTWRSLSLRCAVDGATTAKGIAVTSNGNGCRYLDVTCYGMNLGIDVQHGAEWWMHRCSFEWITGTGLKIANITVPDGGDMSVTDCQFSPQGNAAAAVRYESGGGLRLLNSKVNMPPAGKVGKFSIGLDVAMTNPTSVLLIGNSSFENVAVNAIRVTTGGAVTYGLITVHGCEFGHYNNTAGAPILMTGGFAKSIFGISISSNVFRTGSATAKSAISLTNCDNVRISANVNSGFPAMVDTTSCTSVVLDPEQIATAKGDLLVRTGTGLARLPVGANGTALVADSSQASGLKWSALAGGGSAYGRDRLVAAGGEYTLTVDSSLLANSLIVWKQAGGAGASVALIQGVDYTISGNVVTFTAALAAGDVIVTYYACTAANPTAGRLLKDYSSVVIADNPAGYWTGQDLADGLGGANTLTLQGAGASVGNASIRPSGLGKSFAFGGTGTTGWYKSAQALAALSGASALTFEAWIKAGAFNGSPVYASDIAGWYDGVTYYEMFRIGDGTSGNSTKINVGLSTSTVQQIANSSNALAAGSAYHIVVTWQSGETPKFYMNAALQAAPANNIGGTLRAQSTPFGIGAAVMPGTNRIFNGNIQDVAIYPVALSAARIAAHYAAG